MYFVGEEGCFVFVHGEYVCETSNGYKCINAALSLHVLSANGSTSFFIFQPNWSDNAVKKAYKSTLQYLVNRFDDYSIR